MCRGSLQTRDLCRADTEQEGDSFISFVMHLFQPDEKEGRLPQETDASFVMMIQNESQPLAMAEDH